MTVERNADQLRPYRIERGFTDYAEGSVLISAGNTRVLCNASVADGVPSFLRGKEEGWITAEYSMLPRATSTRSDRESVRGKIGGRTQEISRLVGRSLRAAVDRSELGEYTITLDCDVLQADGGTRCASVTGAMVALAEAIAWMRRTERLAEEDEPIRHFVAAVSVGIVDGKPVLDLSYDLDSRAEVDMNVVMTDTGRYVEIQGTAEGATFTDRQLGRMKKLAAAGIAQLVDLQEKALKKPLE
jgi:ribonuclease PH